MATLGNVRDWVGSKKLKRTDINDEILDFAQEVYYTLCAAVPFPNLETIASPLTLTLDSNELDISSLTDICGIMSVVLYKDTTKVRRLKQTNGRLLDNITRVRSGQPFRYSRRGTVLEVDPAPNASDYKIVLRYWKYPTIASPASDTVVLYPPEWLELHKWETLYRTYMFLENYDAANQLVMPSMLPRYPTTKKLHTHEIGIIPRLWNDLLMNTAQRENYDSDYSINPLRRRYTST